MAQKQADPAELALQLLILRCQSGDERAFERLLEQFGDRTHRYLRGLVGDAADDDPPL
jgi:DNA-directed RNA polymerase specialized sigma24 family protein